MARDWSPIVGAGLAPPAVSLQFAGRGVVIAVVDTGVNFDHPHLAMPQRGFGIERNEGELTVVPRAIRDQYGHGTCCAALVHFLAPDAELFAVRVTSDRATTDADRLALGIDTAAAEGAAIIAVALGTTTRLRAGLDDAVQAALARGAVVVAADPDRGATSVLPACSPGAIGVGHQDGIDVAVTAAGAVVAEGRARPAPGFPRNFWGASLATARAAAALARFAEETKDRGEALARGFKNSLTVL